MSGRGSSTWVLCADAHLTWSQDFGTISLPRAGAALRSARLLPGLWRSESAGWRPVCCILLCDLGPAPLPFGPQCPLLSFVERTTWEFECEQAAWAPADIEQLPVRI